MLCTLTLLRIECVCKRFAWTCLKATVEAKTRKRNITPTSQEAHAVCLQKVPGVHGSHWYGDAAPFRAVPFAHGCCCFWLWPAATIKPGLGAMLYIKRISGQKQAKLTQAAFCNIDAAVRATGTRLTDAIERIAPLAQQ